MFLNVWMLATLKSSAARPFPLVFSLWLFATERQEGTHEGREDGTVPEEEEEMKTHL